MPRKRFTPEQIIRELREAEIRHGQGETLPDVCRTLAISEQTFYRWRKEFGGLKLSQVQRLKGLERENPTGRSSGYLDLSFLRGLTGSIAKRSTSNWPSHRTFGMVAQPFTYRT